MASSNKKGTREYSIPDKLREWKIDRIAVVGNNLLVRYDGKPITSRIDLGDIAGSMKRFRKEAEKKIIDNGVAASYIIDELLLHITNESMEHFESGCRSDGGNGHGGAGGNVRYIGGSSSAIKFLKMSPKATRANCTFDEWSYDLQKKYNALKKLADEKLPSLWLPLEFAISVRCILNIKNISLPFIGIILGPPSSWKSVAVDMQEGSRNSFQTDDFSPKALVSHNSAVSDDELAEIDMLPKIVGKTFLVPELSPIFTAKDDILGNLIGIITRLADGKGYVNDTGAKGHRGYRGNGMFVWIGAAVDIPYKVHKLLSTLGPKLYFLRLPITQETEDELLQIMRQDDFKERLGAVNDALFDYLEYLESCPAMEPDQDMYNTPRLKWNAADPVQEPAQRYIIYLAELLAHLRGTVPTWETKDTQGLDYAFATPHKENVKRAMTQLHNLAKGHALSQGRDYITAEDDLPLIVKVVLSGAASIDRVKILNALIARKKRDAINVDEVAEITKTSPPTARKAMAELKALGLVDLIKLGDGETAAIQIQLKKGFDWVLKNDFNDLKGDYMPGDFSEYLVVKSSDGRCLKEKYPPRAQKNNSTKTESKNNQEDSNNNYSESGQDSNYNKNSGRKQ